MKVLIVCTVRFRMNGITSVIMNYYRNMDKTGMQIDFVVPNVISDEYRKELTENGARIFFLQRKSNPFVYEKNLYRIMEINQYDVVHVHGNSAMMLIDIWPAKKLNVPVRIVHSHNTSCSHMILHKMLLPMFNKCYTHGFSCGQDAGKWLYGDRPFVEVKNGINLKKYRFNLKIRDFYRKKISANDRIVIGHIGNFIEQKNHTFLLDWFSELVKEDDKYLLILISDGSLMDSMKEKAHSLGLDDSVLFLGKTTEVPQYLQAMDIFVLPSLYEGLPVVLIEAQAAGLPCIVADTVAKEVDLTKTLSFLPITNTDIWIKQIKNINIVTDRSVQCEKNQKKIAVAGYDVTQNANQLKELYEEYIESVQRRIK